MRLLLNVIYLIGIAFTARLMVPIFIKSWWDAQGNDHGFELSGGAWVFLCTLMMSLLWPITLIGLAGAKLIQQQADRTGDQR